MQVQYLERKHKPRLAYIYTPPSAGKTSKYPLVMFMGGYRSDMQGTKATYFEEQCRERGQGYVRFDYTGHGKSEGAFRDGTIGSWTQDALDVFDYVADQQVVLVGSSMGGWIALLMGLKRSGLIKGLVGLAAAPDFTEQMFNERLTDKERAELEKHGYFSVPNDYSDEPYIFTKKLYEEAKNHLLLKTARPVDFSMRIIQGMQDKEVPWETAIRIQKAFKADESDILMIEDGDHRLSRPEDLELIDKEIRSISGLL